MKNKKTLLFIIVLVILFLVLFARNTPAQESNLHGSVGTDHTFGVGVDVREGRHLYVMDVSMSKICKQQGGCGRQADIRLIYARRIRDGFSYQAGIVNSYYKVPMFSKNAFQLLGGVRGAVMKERLIGELNYRHDLTSENKVRFLEAQGTLYLPKHIFVRGRTGVQRFKNFFGKTRITGANYIAVGLHF